MHPLIVLSAFGEGWIVAVVVRRVRVHGTPTSGLTAGGGGRGPIENQIHVAVYVRPANGPRSIVRVLIAFARLNVRGIERSRRGTWGGETALVAAAAQDIKWKCRLLLAGLHVAASCARVSQRENYLRFSPSPQPLSPPPSVRGFRVPTFIAHRGTRVIVSRATWTSLSCGENKAKNFGKVWVSRGVHSAPPQNVCALRSADIFGDHFTACLPFPADGRGTTSLFVSPCRR